MSTTEKRKSYKLLNQVIRELRKEFPPDLPVKVIRKKLYDHFGFSTRGKKYYYLYLDSSLGEDVSIYIAWHEWAHLRTWDDQNIDHGTAWALEYGRIYKCGEKFLAQLIDK